MSPSGETPNQIAAIAAALSVVMGQEVRVSLEAPESGWARASRMEALGGSPIDSLMDLPKA